MQRRGKHSGFDDDDYYDYYDDYDDDYYDEDEEDYIDDGHAFEDDGDNNGKGGRLVNRAENPSLDLLRAQGRQHDVEPEQATNETKELWPCVPVPHASENGKNTSLATGEDPFARPFAQDTMDGHTGQAKGPSFQLVAKPKPQKISKSKNNAVVKKSNATEKRQQNPLDDATTVVDDIEVATQVKQFGRLMIGKSRTEVPAAPVSQYHPDEAMIEKLKEELASSGQAGNMHVIIMGHVDAGKSTLTGRLMYEFNCFTEKQVNQCHHESKQMGHNDAHWAFLLDERAEEREHGITTDCATALLDVTELGGKKIVLLDAPGHQDFVPNMISGASQADAAVLVVDGARGGFESGFKSSGQTREHIRLAKCLGVKYLVVVISKMDMIQFDQFRVDEIKEAMLPFLEGCGFTKQHISWIPISAMKGQNLKTSPSEPLFNWYKGPSLGEAMIAIPVPDRMLHLPLRLPILEVLAKSKSLGALSVSGRICAGILTTGMKIILQPGMIEGTVKAIEYAGNPIKLAGAGMTIDIGLHGVTEASLERGAVISHHEFYVPSASKFEMKIVVLDISMPIFRGQSMVLHCHAVSVAAYITQLVATTDKSGNIVKQNPRTLTRNSHAIIQVAVDRNICVEKYKDISSLGRAALRDRGVTVAIGIVTEIVN